MKRAGAAVVALLSLTTLGVQPSVAQSSQELQELRKQIDGLREGQNAMQKDLQEIRNLLRARPAAPGAPAAEAVVGIDGAPFKGNKSAKLTLVEFTDYQ